MADPIEVIRAAVLGDIRHGFLGRRGGVSEGLVAGLNVGLGAIGPEGDNAKAVHENRARALAAVAPGARLVTAYQVHSAVCVIAEPWEEDARPHADALVTAQPGLALGVLTADCAPAGRRGAFAGVCAATVEAMVTLGAARETIAAAVGPAIAQASYEVDDAFHARFLAQNQANAAFFLPAKPGHWHFDLPAYVASTLAAAGVADIAVLGHDTYAEPTRFFSFRRATHRGEAAYGRQIALIAL